MRHSLAPTRTRRWPASGLRAVVEDDEGKIDPRRRYVSKYMLLDWREQVLEADDQRREALRKLWENVVRRDLREMHESGMDLLVGSDVAVLNIYPGFSLHDEVALFVKELGMTPSEVIERATRWIAAVVVGGRLYDVEGIKQLLAAVQAAPDRRLDDWGGRREYSVINETVAAGDLRPLQFKSHPGKRVPYKE